jgi:hypothetical protein
MIRDYRQYRAMQERVLRFRVALATVEAVNASNADPRMRQAGINAMRAQLVALEGELRAYETRQHRTAEDDNLV